MHDVEYHTVCYLRDLLVTRAHDDPEITAFLTFWGFEEFWHGEAIAAVLAAHGEPAGDDRINAAAAAPRPADRLGPLRLVVGSAVATDFPPCT